MYKPQVILGINTNHADSSACILVDGKLIAAIEEERINRIKHFSGHPIASIRECLNIANLSDNQITNITFNTRPFKNIIPKSLFFLKNLNFKKNSPINRFQNKIDIKKFLFKKFNLDKDVKFHYIEHHLAHIASAFYPSQFKQALGLSIDGSGDFVTFALAECKNNKINIKKRIFFPDSLGIFYHGMTQFLGFKNYGDEYKIMGLAAYGKPKYFEKIKNNLFKDHKNKMFELNLKYFNHHRSNFQYISNDNLVIGKIFNDELSLLFKEEIDQCQNKEQYTKDLASSVQKVYEFFFQKILNNLTNDNFSKNIVYAGGCALNSSANRLLTNNHKKFDKIYIPFAPGDNGGALGSAFIVANKLKNELKNIKTPYLGKSFKDEYIKEVLDNIYKNKLTYRHIIDENEFLLKAAKFISEGNVIGWFQGKMEFGPRALGNRSILADPRNPEMKKIINMKIKRRESFRPFAPSVMQEFQADWFESNFDNPYMSSLVTVKKNKQLIIPAVTHFDNTARLQTVSKETNLKFSNLLEHFYKLTRVPILLNTSFNENEPIVMKPEEALNCIIRTDMDAIFMNNFFITKKI
jgi:carbamoyltransferase